MREDEEDEDKTVGKLLGFISALLTPGHQPSPRCALDTLILGRFGGSRETTAAGSAADAARCSPGSSSSDQPSMRHSQLRCLAAVDLLLNRAILPEKLRSTSAPTLLTRLATLASIPQCVALAGSDPTNPASLSVFRNSGTERNWENSAVSVSFPSSCLRRKSLLNRP